MTLAGLHRGANPHPARMRAASRGRASGAASPAGSQQIAGQAEDGGATTNQKYRCRQGPYWFIPYKSRDVYETRSAKASKRLVRRAAAAQRRLQGGRRWRGEARGASSANIVAARRTAHPRASTAEIGVCASPALWPPATSRGHGLAAETGRGRRRGPECSANTVVPSRELVPTARGSVLSRIEIDPLRGTTQRRAARRTAPSVRCASYQRPGRSRCQEDDERRHDSRPAAKR